MICNLFIYLTVKFKQVNNLFQKQCQDDKKNTSQRLYSCLLIKLSICTKSTARTYDKLLQDNINASYKKTDSNTAKKINNEAKAIPKKLKLENRIEILTKKKAFITFKDHKPNFINNSKLSTLPNLI